MKRKAISSKKQKLTKDIEDKKKQLEKKENLLEKKLKQEKEFKSEKIEKEKIRLMSEIKNIQFEMKAMTEVLQELEEKEKEIERKEIEKKKKGEEEKKRKEEEENKKLEELLKRQKMLRNEEAKNENDEKKTEKLKSVIEDMCIMGDITKKQIIKEKDNKEKYISIEETKKLIQKPSPTDDDKALFCLGILAQSLEEKDILTLIDKNPDKEGNNEECDTSINFLINGLMDKPKYALSFDFGEKKNEELLKDEKQQKLFNDKIKKKLALEYNIPESEIIVTNPQKGSYKVHVIFLSEKFNDLTPEQLKQDIKNNLDDKEFKELSNLKDIQKKVILEGIKLRKDMIDHRGNQTPENYATGQKRGGIDYNPPRGWIGYGLNVLDKYGDNNWIGMDGNDDEWAVAYHGIGRGSNDVEGITNKIIQGGFKIGQYHKLEDCEDLNNPGHKIGRGIYVSPNIEYIEENDYVGKSNTTINGKRFKVAFMLRVKPDKIRRCSEYPDEWVLGNTSDEIRPYRILLKEE